MIFTFYSFKGGVGRSMAVANIAEMFFARGLKVLMVDFDLEAPGLERYFDVPNALTPGPEVLSRRGVIDAILSFRELQAFAPKLPPAASSGDDGTPSFPFSTEPLSSFIVPIYDSPTHPGKLSLMPAGDRRKPGFEAYAKRVLDLDWGRFCTQEDGERFFEWFRLELVRDWDVVLIDSRTGVTELGGVCTHHLADVVVSFVATNMQNLEGTAMMASSLANPELVSKGRKGRPLQLLFVPSRVELSEEDKHDDFAARFDGKLGGFFPTNQTPERSWFLDLRLLYVAAYSYLERVAVREPERASKADLIDAYGRLAARMASIAGPGALFDSYAPAPPTVSNVPPRNPYFSGRDEELKTVRALIPNGTPVALCGMAGMGKTGTAIEYAYRYRNEYTCMLFVHAGSESELRRCCEEIARLLSLPPQTASPVDAVRAWLEQNGGWLLIVDDANDPALAHSLVPATPRGHVLYTTQTQQLGALVAQPVALDILPASATLRFFEKRLGRGELSDSERAAAAQLVEEVGALPLALEQAAAYCANRRSRIQDYLTSFRKRRLSLLDQQTAMIAGKTVSFSAVLEPTLEEIEKTPASADVLRVASYLAPDPIPITFFVAGASHLGDAIASALAGAADDPLAIDEVLDPLTRFSLVERDQAAQTFALHRLVSELVRSRASRDAGLWHDRIVAALDAAFPEPTWETGAVCAALIPHVQAVMVPSDPAPLRFRGARYLLLRGDAPKAEVFLREHVSGQPGAENAIFLDLLAQSCYAQSRFAEATQMLREAVEECAKWNLDDEIRMRLNLDLAACLAASGSFMDAELAYLRVANDALKRSDYETMVVASCGRATMLANSNPEKGVEVAQQAVNYAQQSSLPAQAMALSTLASALIFAGRALEPRTIEVLQEALARGEQVYGPEHPALARMLLNYSILLHALGRESEAQAVYQRGQTIIDQVFSAGSVTSAQFREEYERLASVWFADDKPRTPTP